MAKNKHVNFYYNPNWEKELLWLKPHPIYKNRAFCVHCKLDLKPKLGLLKDHGKSRRHLDKAPLVNMKVNKIPFQPVNVVPLEVKKLEIKLAALAVCHTSFNTVNHMSEILKEEGKGSALEKIKLHRTKVSALSRNVLSKAFSAELKEELKDKSFSILIDESTDTSCKKLLAVLVRHWDTRSQKLMDDLLGLVEVIGTTGEELFQAVERLMAEYSLEFKNCISFASDGASNVAGIHNSVWSRFRDANPHCVQIKCICHSLALVVKHAYDAHMPDSLCNLLHKVPTYFSKSAIRRQDFLEIQKVMYSGMATKGTSPFQKYCDTRWLARAKVMKNIYKEWDTLEAYFVSIKDDVPSEARVDVAVLIQTFKDRSKQALLAFLIPIVEDLERINAMFQGTEGAEKAYEELALFHKALKMRVMTSGPVCQRKPFKDVDFGMDFDQIILQFTRGAGNREELALKATETRSRAWGFLLRLLEETEKRLPSNMAVFKQMSFFSPARILGPNPPMFSEMPFIECIVDHEDLSDLEQQLRKVTQVAWREAEPFKALGAFPTDPVIFWSGVLAYTTGG
jgi:hypothetical protein